MNEPDKRKMERFDLKLPTKISWTRKHKEKRLIELMTNNICAGGAYFEMNRPLPKGTGVKLDLILELWGRQSRIDVSGFVTRTNHQGMAICFDKNCKISANKITDF